MKQNNKQQSTVRAAIIVAVVLILLSVAYAHIANERYWAREQGIHGLKSTFAMEEQDSGRRFSYTACLFKMLTFRPLTYNDLLPEIVLVPTAGEGRSSTYYRIHNFICNLYNPTGPDAVRIDNARFMLAEKGYISPKADILLDHERLIFDLDLLAEEERLFLETIINDPKKSYEIITLLVDYRINLNYLIYESPN